MDKEFNASDYSEHEDYLMHYGTPRHSGRYPYGSGDNPGQHGSADFLTRVDDLKKKGMSDKEIVKALGMKSVTELRDQKAIARAERRTIDFDKAKSMREDGKSFQAIADELGMKNESSVRSLLNAESEAKMKQARAAADVIEKTIDKKGCIDVGSGVERELKISKEKMRQALKIVENDGYNIYPMGIPQATNPGQQSNTKIAAPSDVTYHEAYLKRDAGKIKPLSNYVCIKQGEGGITPLQPPKSVDSSRIAIKYREDGGIEKDGVIELRRGVEDISLGNSRYAQVRIAVDGTHYLKGMAMYSDDIPKGKDIVFNTNKQKGTPMKDVLKPLKDDKDNPFGALIKQNGQRTYVDKNGKEQLSVINKVREEGDWGEWSKTLSSQMLSKQTLPLIKGQLKITLANKEAEFDEIKSLTNPTIKKHFLLKFANSCDADAVSLKAAALPRQKVQVILPVATLKDDEVYAPNFNNGEKVALIRYPHGGTFEIPILKVNNNHRDANRIIGNDAIDAIGINSNVAERLSGADFDGDTVSVLPTGRRVKIHSTPPLKGLEGFDPKTAYPARPGMKELKHTDAEMGNISNLITDMTLRSAPEEDVARAARHSMVVIDAQKHHLDYKRSEEVEGISALKKKYQAHILDDGKEHYGASTLISARKATTAIPERKGQGRIQKDGTVEYNLSNRTYVDKKTGKVVNATIKVPTISVTDDVRKLSSGTPQEEAYAIYSNHCKELGNRARKAYLSAGNLKYNKDASVVYSQEVSALKTKLNKALLNAPRERQANIIANSVANAKKRKNPDMTKKELKKEKQRALEEARIKVGSNSKMSKIKITDKEWEAIQAGAITDNVLRSILDNTDTDALRKRATPRQSTVLSPAKRNQIEAMRGTYTIAQIADALGVSTSTVANNLRRGDKS